MEKNKQIINMTLDIMNEASFPLELSGTIAESLYDKGWRKDSDIVLEAIDEMKERLKKFVDNDISLHSSLPCCSVLWHFTDGIDQIASQLKKKYTVGEKE